MKVYLEPLRNADSRGNRRIYQALRAGLPEGWREADYDSADFYVFYVVGRHDHMKNTIQTLMGKPYAMIQIALGSTKNPDPQDWMWMWENARVVWSYYQLPIDGYYHAPLGVDPRLFYPVQTQKRYKVLINGENTRGEALDEVRRAVSQFGENACIHPRNVSDDYLRELYAQSYYVSALRHWDGFELPAIEGLLCGARPIVFDTPNYRQWYEGLAEFIPDGSPEQIIKALTDVFSGDYRPVTEQERALVRERYGWEKIVAGFWERCK